MCYFSPHCSCQRMCESWVYICAFPCHRAGFCVQCALLSSTTHPCLLSSSGSSPVELEHRAQILSASEDFILRTKTNKRKNMVSTSKNCATFLQLTAHIVFSMIAQKQWQNRTQVVVSTQSALFFQYQRRPLLVFTQSVFNQDGLLRSTEHRRATIWQLQKLHLRLLNQGRLKSYRFGFSLSLWQTGAGSSGSSWIDAAAASRSRGAWASASRPASGEHHEDIFKDRAFSLHLAGERWMVKAAVTSHNEVIPEWKKEVLHSRLFFFSFFVLTKTSHLQKT